MSQQVYFKHGLTDLKSEILQEHMIRNYVFEMREWCVWKTILKLKFVWNYWKPLFALFHFKTVAETGSEFTTHWQTAKHCNAFFALVRCEARVRSAPRVLAVFFSRALLLGVLIREKTTVLQSSIGMAIDLKAFPRMRFFCYNSPPNLHIVQPFN